MEVLWVSNALRADLVLLNGRVITVNSKMPRAEAVAVKDGKIVGVGTDRAIRRLVGRGTRIIDLKGMAVLPGFIDAHNHLWGFGVALSQVDCRSPPVKSVKEIVEKIGERAAKTPEGRWVVGWGYDDTKLEERRHPNRWDLDTVAPSNPVMIRRTCGHTCVVNSRALERVGYRADTPQPEGGEIEKDQKTGEPTGVLRETAMKPVNDLARVFSVEELMEAIKLGQERLLSEGITSCHEAGLDAKTVKAYQNLLASGQLKVRVYMMVQVDLLSQIVETGLVTGFGNEWLRIGSIKMMMDGGMGGKTAALYEPYEGTCDNRGIIYMSQERLNELVKKAHEAGFQIAIHAIGDRAIDVSLNALEAALRAAPRKDHRHRIEHCGLSTPAITERLVRLGVIPVGQPPFLFNIGDSFLSNLGADRIRWTYPFRTWLDKNIPAPGSSDRPVVLGAPLLGIWACVNRKTERGRVLAEEERITPEEAIKMYTLNAAFASFEEETKGSIEPGKLADLVVLSADPCEVPVDEIKSIKIEMTIVGGSVAYQAR
jgi:predicted amidohydrolase YtcJ